MHTSAHKEDMKKREQVALNVIKRAEKFMRDQGEHELADIWIDEMLETLKEVKKT